MPDTQQADNQSDDKTTDPKPELDLLLQGGHHCYDWRDRPYNAAEIISVHLLASCALISPTPATTAANAAARSGAFPFKNWIATLDTVATIVRMPNTVVFIIVFG